MQKRFKENFKKFLSPTVYYRFLQHKLRPAYKKSYSQQGEDLIILSIFRILKIPKPAYLDIGTNDPKFINNTYLFYKRGWKGVCIEPDPILFKKIQRVRSRDTVINAGIGTSSQSSATFYLMDDHRLNTFSKSEAERMKAMGHTIKNTLEIPLIPINRIVKENFDTYPNFVSLDTEGLDLDILKTFDFTTYKPEVFCIETVMYEKGRSGRKIPEIRALMEKNGYFVFSDTYVNTIFVSKDAWQQRGNEIF